MNNSVKVNSFVMRQVKSSGKTYSTLSFEEIANYAEEQVKKNNYKLGYRDGVIRVNVEPNFIKYFICPFTRLLDNTRLVANMVKRTPEEEPYIQIRALNGDVLITESVDLILYRHDVLSETNEQEFNEGWELIAFHAIPEGITTMPMGPITMMRNQLQLKGGSNGRYNSDEWAESINFWQKYAVLQPTEDN